MKLDEILKKDVDTLLDYLEFALIMTLNSEGYTYDRWAFIYHAIREEIIKRTGEFKWIKFFGLFYLLLIHCV